MRTTTRWLLTSALPRIEREGLTLVGISVANLEDAATLQLPLPLDPRAGGALDAALDEIRARFGSDGLRARCCLDAILACSSRYSLTEPMSIPCADRPDRSPTA